MELSKRGAPAVQDATADGGDRPSVVVLPFTVQGDENLAYLEEGMVDLLGTKLDGMGEIRSVDPNAVLGLLRGRDTDSLSPEQGQEIAQMSRHVRQGLYVRILTVREIF